MAPPEKPRSRLKHGAKKRKDIKRLKAIGTSMPCASLTPSLRFRQQSRTLIFDALALRDHHLQPGPPVTAPIARSLPYEIILNIIDHRLTEDYDNLVDFRSSTATARGQSSYHKRLRGIATLSRHLLHHVQSTLTLHHKWQKDAQSAMPPDTWNAWLLRLRDGEAVSLGLAKARVVMEHLIEAIEKAHAVVETDGSVLGDV